MTRMQNLLIIGFQIKHMKKRRETLEVPRGGKRREGSELEAPFRGILGK